MEEAGEQQRKQQVLPREELAPEKSSLASPG